MLLEVLDHFYSVGLTSQYDRVKALPVFQPYFIQHFISH